MSESVSLPALGESVTEGTVTRWLKNVGDQVEVDEPLLEVSTDKVDTEIPSPVAGVIEQILVQEDETVDVGTALVTIGDGSGAGVDAPSTTDSAEAATEQVAPDVADMASAPETETSNSAASAGSPAAASEESLSVEPAAEEAPSATAPEKEEDEEEETDADVPEPVAAEPASEQPLRSASGSSHAGAGYVTPIVRKLANEQGVDLSTVSGSGVGGRIRKQDILSSGTPPQVEESEVGESAPEAPPVKVSPLRGTTVPMTRLRKVVAERAVISMQSSAQLTTVVEVDVTAIASLRERFKERFAEKTGSKLSFTPFFALAAAEALKSYPVINASIEGDTIIYPDHENLSIAVDTERGLLTPVVRDASDLNIAQLAQQVTDLASRTRDNKLKPDELAGGTFTLTNTGSRGALFDTPLVFLPQVAILGTGIVTKKPVVVEAGDSDAIAVRSMVYLALSYDHRIVDGADAARFLVTVKNRLEGGAFEGDLGI